MTDQKMKTAKKCYLCSSIKFKSRTGIVRDNPKIKIIECCDCNLVFLDSHDHIRPRFYEDSGMHGLFKISMNSWLSSSRNDDIRRVNMLKPLLINKMVLDFGCGAGGFLGEAKKLATEVVGVEIETRVRKYWKGKLDIRSSLNSTKPLSKDIITAFHVIEHLKDPRSILKILAQKLAKDGRLIIEVPNSDDALLALFQSRPFQEFTYWSQHLYLFNNFTLKRLAEQAGLNVLSIQHIQRYPLSNHLYWLRHGKPGGHQKWAFLNSQNLHEAYSSALAKIGKTDTIVAYLEKGSSENESK